MSSQGGQGDDKHSMQILWIIFGIFFISAIVWFFLAEELLTVFLYIRWFELGVIRYTLQWIPFVDVQEVIALHDLTKVVSAAALKENTQLAATMSEVVGIYFRWPIALILGYYCWYNMQKNVKVRYRKRYNMKSLMEQEKALWPQIQAVSGIDLLKEDLNDGPWAMAHAPLKYARDNKLVDIHVVMPEGALAKNYKFDVVLDHERTNLCFARQLGRMWQGPEHMPPHRRALFAAFAARGSRDSKAAADLLAQMAKTGAGTGEVNTIGADDLWKKHYKNRDVQDICNAHAYEYCIFISMLLYARQDGVLATADFLWLKPRDRQLWYVLNNVGRQTPACEGAGVHAHWLAEKAIGRPLSIPMVKEATKALESALGDIIYVPTPEEKDELLKNRLEGNQ